MPKENNQTTPEPAYEVDSPVFEDVSLVCMDRSRLVATLLLLYGWRWLLLLAVATLVTFCIGLFVDLRWMIIAVMIIFLVSPLLMAFLYFYHGLKPLTAINVVPHRLSVTEEGVTITIPERAYNESQDENPTEPKERLIHCRFSSFYDVLSGSSGYLMMALARDKGFLWVPYSIFSDETHTENFMRSFQASRPKP